MDWTLRGFVSKKDWERMVKEGDVRTINLYLESELPENDRVKIKIEKDE